MRRFRLNPRTTPLRLYVLTLCVCATAGCQQNATQIGAERNIIAEVITGSEITPNLRAISTPGGRISGSENGRRAEQWVADKLRSYGLAQVHFEPFTMTSWLDRKTEVTILDDPPVRLEIAQALGNTLSTPLEGITSEIVDVGHGVPDDFDARKSDLPGKFAMAHCGNMHRREKMDNALKCGALGLLHISNFEDRVIVGTCHRRPRPEPGIAITKKDGDMIAERLAKGEHVRVNVKVDAECWEAEPRNVVAEIPGVGPLAHEVIIIGAHLDSWHLGEGALDNGTGSATILEVARALRAADPHPKRTIRFVWFQGEEHGIFGSYAYARAHDDEMDRIRCVVNVDMPGEPRSFIHHGHPEMVPFLKRIIADLPGYGMEEDVHESVHIYSDHAPFMKRGVCAVSLSGEMGPGVKYYHTRGDLFENVEPRGLSGAAAVLAVLVHRLANDSDMPARRQDPDVLRQMHGWADEF